MLGLYYAPGACSMAVHIVLEESGEKYEPIRIDLTKGEQRSEAYLKVFYTWRARRELPVGELKNYTALDRMLQRPAVQRALADEEIKV